MYIGIDLHKETCYATTLDKEGEIIDRREFKNLAKLLRADFLPQSYIPSKAIRENRELLRLRVQLGKDRTMIKNRIHALMAKNGVKQEFSDLFGVEGRNFLREIELPKLQRIALDVLQRQLAIKW
jgi:hypothetical protein